MSCLTIYVQRLTIDRPVTPKSSPTTQSHLKVTKITAIVTPIIVSIIIITPIILISIVVRIIVPEFILESNPEQTPRKQATAST
jgi:hypothetical protein